MEKGGLVSSFLQCTESDWNTFLLSNVLSLTSSAKVSNQFNLCLHFLKTKIFSDLVWFSKLNL